MRWCAQTADALAWLPGWLEREPELLLRLAAEAPALLPALAARFLPGAVERAPPHGRGQGVHLPMAETVPELRSTAPFRGGPVVAWLLLRLLPALCQQWLTACRGPALSAHVREDGVTSYDAHALWRSLSR